MCYLQHNTVRKQSWCDEDVSILVDALAKRQLKSYGKIQDNKAPVFLP